VHLNNSRIKDLLLAPVGAETIDCGKPMIEETWSVEDVERLRGLWTQGVTPALIARQMGRTRSAVVGKLHRLGLSRPEARVSTVDSRLRKF
jgi:hypothetical protein